MTQYICKDRHISATPQPQLLFCHTCDGPVEVVSDELPFIEPKRIQRSRKAGWRKPENTVNVTRPGKWGNPFNWKDNLNLFSGITESECKQIAVDEFKAYLHALDHLKIIEELKGKNLMCWCKVGDPCHGDVLLEIANS